MRALNRTVCWALATFTVACASVNEDHTSVRRVVHDYVEAIEQGKPALIEGSVDPDLHKFGYSRSSSGGGYRKIPMTYEQLVNLASTIVEDGYVPDAPEHSIEVFDVLDKTASVKLTAFWGIDYMHLAKIDGEWKIVQVIWQSAPPTNE